MKRAAFVPGLFCLLVVAGCDFDLRDPDSFGARPAPTAGPASAGPSDAGPPTALPPPPPRPLETETAAAGVEAAPVEEEKPVAPTAAAPAFREITLPSGTVLKREMYEFARSRLFEMFRTGTSYYLNVDDKDVVVGAYTYDDQGKLEGSAATFYAAATPMCVTAYDDSRREGPTWVWEESGQLAYWCEYRNGRKHGLACLLENNAPWYVQEWRLGLASRRYLIKLEGEVFVAHEIDSDAPTSDEVALAAGRIDALDARLAESERRDKQGFAKWYREREERERRLRYTRTTASDAQKVMEEARAHAAIEAAEKRRRERWQNWIWRWGL